MKPSPTLYKLAVSLLAGWLVAISALPAQAEATGQFGRLFTKPSERSSLNSLRQSQQLKVLVPQDKPDEVETASPSNPITLQGYVKRSDGATTLWVNKQSVQEDSMVDDVSIGRLNRGGHLKKGANPEGLEVNIPASGKKIHLKAGQMYQPETEQIIELQVVEKAKRLNLQETGLIESSTTEANKLRNRPE